MSQTVSPGADKLYGVQRVCRIWEQARSTFYDVGRQTSDEPPKRRGPRPSISDEDLLGMICHDLATLAVYPAKGTARSGRVFAFVTACESLANGCCV